MGIYLTYTCTCFLCIKLKVALQPIGSTSIIVHIIIIKKKDRSNGNIGMRLIGRRNMGKSLSKMGKVILPIIVLKLTVCGGWGE